MRLFVALQLPDTAIQSITRIQDKLKGEIGADRWQPLANLHLTLHFLGDVEDSLIPLICKDMDLVSSIIEPFTLVLGSFGAFPRAEKPRVLWLGLNGQRKVLSQLHLLLGKRFDLHEGLHYDRRPYHPHITLARGPHVPVLPLLEWDERLLEMPPARWQAREVHLFRSELRPEGAVHTVIHTSRFQKLLDS
ncbi:RNA 2',3'-cyclic phosphodiesterase [Brevibacillus fluminis]|uniref:RNA 2',3'-cyclic phosphodiesterase n=1 Tax=Brevibacillus fluminis TaxID=511487 RepID=A0A3M8DK63_9BACL|nr:RNA 2',3'-cyclic phosphodiesterase [Brevibacillus fluminis]RNB87785.1 RNA 2',3'-cyclic phosphodiesterase [Brevibacillus fluminis]